MPEPMTDRESDILRRWRDKKLVEARDEIAVLKERVERLLADLSEERRLAFSQRDSIALFLYRARDKYARDGLLDHALAVGLAARDIEAELDREKADSR